MQTDDTTGRFAVLEDRVERLRADVRDHGAEDRTRFDKLDVVLDEMRGEFKAVRDSIARLATSAEVTSAKGSWVVAALVGGLSFLGTVAVAVAEHLWR